MCDIVRFTLYALDSVDFDGLRQDEWSYAILGATLSAQTIHLRCMLARLCGSGRCDGCAHWKGEGVVQRRGESFVVLVGRILFLVVCLLSVWGFLSLLAHLFGDE